MQIKIRIRIRMHFSRSESGSASKSNAKHWLKIVCSPMNLLKYLQVPALKLSINSGFWCCEIFYFFINVYSLKLWQFKKNEMLNEIFEWKIKTISKNIQKEWSISKICCTKLWLKENWQIKRGKRRNTGCKFTEIFYFTILSAVLLPLRQFIMSVKKSF